ncbi:MAG: MlaD family protein [Myxococcota bacterium]
MNARQLEIRVGVGACGVVALFFVLSAVFGATEAPPPIAIQVDFPSASGLKVGSKVCVAGVPAGEVTGMSAHDGAYDEAVNRRVFVRADLAIDPEQAARIGQDGVFTVTTEGVLGERYVEITPGAIDAPRLRGGLILPGVRSFRQKELSENAGTVGRIVGQLARKHAAPLATVGADVRTVMSRSSSAMDRAALLAEVQTPKAVTLRERGGETEIAARALADDVLRTMAAVEAANPVVDLRRASTALKRGGAAVDKDAAATLATFEGLRASGVAFAEVVDAGTSAVSKASAPIAGDIRALRRLIHSIETSLGALMRDREFLDDVLGMTKDVKRHPWKMLMRWEQ